MSELFQSKALLAKLLAKEDLVIEQRNVSTAHFDLVNRILCIPILKSTLTPQEYDLFIGHEVGHALFTPQDDWKRTIATFKLPKSIVNVVEDARIERKIKNKYPGLRNSFIRAYNNLYYMNFFGTRYKDVNEFNFIDRANLYFKIGAKHNIQFKNEKEKRFLKEIEETDTFSDVITLSRKIADYMREEVKSVKLSKLKIEIEMSDDDLPFGDSIETTESVEELMEQLEELMHNSETKMEVEEKKNDSEDGDSETQSNPSGNGDEDGDSETQSNPSGNGDGEDDGQTVADLPEEKQEEIIEKLIESETDEAYNEKSKDLYDQSSLPPIYMKVPDLKTDKMIVSFKSVIQEIKKQTSNWSGDYLVKTHSEYVEYQKSLNKTVSYLVKEFELRKNADQQKRAKISKTGEIDSSRLHSYRFSEDIFKRLTNIPEGKSHGLVLFLDWSGSMSTNIRNTIKQLLSLVLFCKKVNIPFEVYAFADKFSHVNEGIYEIKSGDLAPTTCRLINIFSSRMSASEFKTVASFMTMRNSHLKPFMPMANTPLNTTIMAAMKIVPKFKNQNRLQIVNTVFLTDGSASDMTGYYDKEKIKRTFGHTNYVITDPVTRHEVKAKRMNHVTFGLLELLKYRTGCKILGFYVVDTRNFTEVSSFLDEEDLSFLLKKKEEFLEEKCVMIDAKGYDKFYVIKDENQSSEDFGDVTISSKTVKGLVSAFSKHSMKKIQTKTVLNSFIQMIA
jgi:hypothetical protein